MARIPNGAILINRIIFLLVLTILFLSCSRKHEVKVISCILNGDIYTKCVAVSCVEPADTIIAAIISRELIPYAKQKNYNDTIFEIEYFRDSTYYFAFWDTEYENPEEPDICALYDEAGIRFLIHKSALPLFKTTSNKIDTISYKYSNLGDSYPFDPDEWFFHKTGKGYRLDELLKPYDL